MSTTSPKMLVHEELWAMNAKFSTILALYKSGMCDEKFYLSQYPEVIATGLSPVEHYVLHGAAEGKKPVWWFETSLYLKEYPDVADSEINPFWHYLRYGENEHRRLLFSNITEAIKFAELFMSQRDFPEALRRWAVVREKFPNHHAGYTRASAACLELADWAQAEAFSKEAMEKVPGDITSFISYAEVAMRQRDFDEALKRWAVVREKFPNHHAGYTRASATCLELADWAQAEAFSKEAMEKVPGDITSFISHAEVAMRQRNFEDALKRWAVVREKFPNHHAGYTRASAACLELADWAQAEAFSKEAMEKVPGDITSFISHAEVVMRQRDFDEALRRWAVVREKFPSWHQGYTRASATCLELADWAQAEVFSKEATEKVPGDITSFISHAEVVMRQRDFDEALRRWAVVREKFPSWHQGYIRTCDTYIDRSDWVKAKSFANIAIEKFYSIPLSYGLSSDIFTHQKQFKEAAKYLNLGLDIFPRNAYLLNKFDTLKRLEAKNNCTAITKHNSNDASLAKLLHLISKDIDDALHVKQLVSNIDACKECVDVAIKYIEKKIYASRILREYEFSGISMGATCWVAGFLSRWGLKSINKYGGAEKLPFCSANHGDYNTVLKILLASFDGYFSDDNIVEYFNRHENENTACFFNKYFNVYFNHDFVSNYKDKNFFIDELQARVNRFLALTKERALFICATSGIVSDLGRQAFTTVSDGILNKGNALLVIDESNSSLREISHKTYLLGNARHKQALNSTSLKKIFTLERYEMESNLIDSIIYIVQNSFDKREIVRNVNEEKISTSTYQDELFSDIQMRTFVDDVLSKLNGSTNNGTIVMNCNPFTNGHNHLVEYAASQVEKLIIFVVEEDKSFFKFADRIQLVRDGVAHLKNVIVVPSGKFIISTTTFPEYFFKDNPELGEFDATKDVTFFGKYIAPALNIKVRFLGTEPNCHVTSQYNKQMHEILPTFGVRVEEIGRKELNSQPISASLVRTCLQSKDFGKIKDLVPDSTYRFLVEHYGEKSSSCNELDPFFRTGRSGF